MIFYKIYYQFLKACLGFYFLFFKKFKYTDKYGLSYYIYKENRPVDTFINRVRTDDSSVLEIISEILRKNKNKNINCLDVGAYMGLITIHMSKLLNENGKVHSFEPFQKSYEHILKNISLNNLCKNIILNNLSILDQNIDKVELVETPLERGNEFLSVKKYKGSSRVNTVKAVRLDSYLNEKKITNIKICKIDAEGVDDLVLLSLGTFLENKKVDFIIVEFNNDLEKKLQKIIETYRYRLYYIVRNKGKLVNALERYPKESKSPLNVLCVSPNAELKLIEKLILT